MLGKKVPKVLNFDADESSLNQRHFFNPPYVVKTAAPATLPQGASTIEKQLHNAKLSRSIAEKQGSTQREKSGDPLTAAAAPTESAPTACTAATTAGPSFLSFASAQGSTSSRSNAPIWPDSALASASNVGVATTAESFSAVFQNAAEALNPTADIDNNPADAPFASIVPAYTEVASSGKASVPYHMRASATVNHDTPRPRGVAGSLDKMSFVRTGNLRTMSDSDLKLYIANLGGSVKTAVSSKTNYLIVGNDPGMAKLRDAKRNFVKVIPEAEFYELIMAKGSIPTWIPWVTFTESLQPFSKEELADLIAEHSKKEGSGDGSGVPLHEGEELIAIGASSGRGANGGKKMVGIGVNIKTRQECDASDVGRGGEDNIGKSQSPVASVTSVSPALPVAKAPVPADAAGFNVDAAPTYEMHWISKYKPTRSAEIAGNNLIINQLRIWLTWWSSVFLGKTSIETIFSSKENAKYEKGMKDRFNYKAAIVSGLPGIGKTLATELLVKECGYNPFYLSVAEPRSKSVLQDLLINIFGGRNIASFAVANSARKSSNVCLIVDECEAIDAGGTAYLLSAMNKDSNRVPVIFICNSLYNQKLGTLRTKCASFPFDRPQKDIVGRYLLMIAESEGVPLQSSHASLIAERVRSDVRYAINELQFATTHHKKAGYSAKSLASLRAITTTPSIFDTWNMMLDFRVLKAWAASETNRQHYTALISLHMGDTALNTAGIFQNYRTKTSGLLSYTAIISDLLSTSEVMLSRMMSVGDWSCSRDQAVFASVLPNILLSTLDLSASGGTAYGRQNAFPSMVLGVVSSAKAATLKMDEFRTTSTRHGVSGRSSVLADEMPLFASVLTKGWELHGDALTQNMKKGKDLTDEEILYASFLSEAFNGVSMDTWKEYSSNQNITVGGRSQAALTAYLQTVTDYGYKAVETAAGKKGTRARKVKQ